MRAVVVAHGDVLPADRAAIEAEDLVVAADGGAFALERWKILPHLVVGDMDSLGDAGVERLARQGIGVVKFPAAKDESDLELAVTHAINAGAKEIVLLGARGGGSLALEGPVGTVVTLLPVAGDAEGVRTEGLRFPLAGETLRLGKSRGLSNEIAQSPARVTLDKGSLLVFETPQGGT